MLVNPTHVLLLWVRKFATYKNPMPFSKLTLYKRKAAVRRRALTRRYAVRARRPLRRRNNVRALFGRPVPMANNGAFPMVRNCKLVYGVDIPLTTTTFTGYRLRLGSLYDPDLTGTGHQPRGFDELAAIYSRYRVYGCAVKITSVISSGVAGTAYLCVQPYPLNSTSNPSSFLEAQEIVNSRIIPISDSRKNVFKAYYPSHVALGVTKREFMNNDDYSAAVTTNPVNCGVLHIALASPNQTTTCTATINVIMTFYCQFSERGKLPQS